MCCTSTDSFLELQLILLVNTLDCEVSLQSCHIIIYDNISGSLKIHRRSAQMVIDVVCLYLIDLLVLQGQLHFQLRVINQAQFHKHLLLEIILLIKIEPILVLKDGKCFLFWIN